MKEKILKRYNIIVLISVIVMIVAFVFSISFMNRTSSRLTDETATMLGEFYLSEIADRAEASTIAIIDKQIQCLEKDIESVGFEKDNYSVSEIAQCLGMTEKVEELQEIVLIGNNGESFCSTGVCDYREAIDDFSLPIERRASVDRTDSANILTVSFPVSNISVAGVSIVGCTARLYMESLIDPGMLTPESEQSKTYTRLFSRDGDNVLNMEGGSMDNSNLFERYEQTATFSEGYSVEKLKEDWASGNSGYAVYSTDQGNSQIYYQPIEGTNLMVMCLSRLTTINQVISESNNELTRISVFQTVFAIVVFCIFTFLIIWSISQSRKQQEQAEYIKEITKLNEELDIAKQGAEAANNAKTSFLFNMSHDIRTPMNAIMGFRDLLEKHQEEPERRQDYLRKIEDSSNVLLSIINNVLEMARIEKGSLEIDETVWSTEQFNDTIFSIFNEMMAEKNISFTREIHVQHSFVYCDPIKLREIFINILSNAYKYTNAGGSVNMILEEIPSEREGYVLYRTTISDTGIGISEEFLPHIYDEFSRENNTTDNKIEGTGLGMPIVKRLIELMDGTIEVKSTKGEGSTFIVTIPHRIAERSSLVERAGVEIDPKLFKGKRILLAEDNELNAEIAVEMLSEVGFIVDVASDGVICCDMLRDSKEKYYSLVLMDIQMPNMNGYEATRKIRKMTDYTKSNIPIIAMTANAFEEDKKEALRAGMNAHIAKPAKISELLRVLGMYLS